MIRRVLIVFRIRQDLRLSWYAAWVFSDGR